MKVVFARLSSLELRQLFCIADLYGFHPTNVKWRSYYLGHEKDGGVWAQHWWSGSGIGYFLFSESTAFRKCMADALADGCEKIDEAKISLPESNQLACLLSILELPIELISKIAASAANIVFEHEIVGPDIFEFSGYQSSMHRERKFEESVQALAICHAPMVMPDVLQNHSQVFLFDWYVIAHGYEGIRPTPELDIKGKWQRKKTSHENFTFPISCFFGLLAIADAYGFDGPSEGRFWAMYYHILTPEEPFRWWNTAPIQIQTFGAEEVTVLRTCLLSARTEELKTAWEKVDSLPMSTVRRRLREAVASVGISELNQFCELLEGIETLSWKFYEGDLVSFFPGQ